MVALRDAKGSYDDDEGPMRRALRSTLQTLKMTADYNRL